MENAKKNYIELNDVDEYSNPHHFGISDSENDSSSNNQQLISDNSGNNKKSNRQKFKSIYANSENNKDLHLHQHLLSSENESIGSNKFNDMLSMSDYSPEMKAMINSPSEAPLLTYQNKVNLNKVNSEVSIDGLNMIQNSTNENNNNLLTKKITFFSFFDLDWELTIEALPSLIVSVIGLTLAGWLLDIVKGWDIYVSISELIVLIPILLNLKGNLEMNLASRLSTESNLGHLDNYDSAKDIILGNMAVLQSQAFIVGTISGIFTWLLGGVTNGYFLAVDKTVLLVISSVLSASICSFILGAMVSVIIIYSRKFKINPDNVATPLAASIGDLVTLLVLSVCGHILIKIIGSVTNDIILIILLALIPVWCYISLNNKYVKDVLFAGWVPIIASLIITSFAGLVFERYMDSYNGIAVIMPVLNGIVGNIGSLYVSRLSTDLHIGVKKNYFKTFITLFWINIPTEFSFILLIDIFKLGDTNTNILFITVYSIMSTLLMMILLLFAHKMTYWFWNKNLDPDNYCLPTLTAISDVLGTIFLVLQYYILTLLGDSSNTINN